MANIIICADGTWNRPEHDKQPHPTNVLKLARAIAPQQNDIKQHVFYDWGIGSYHSSFLGGAMGRGIEKNITDGYRYIVQNYNPGDQIYLFGFSRGAYTVRSLSGLINNCGILKRTHAHLIDEAWKRYKYKSDRHAPKGEASLEFRDNYAHDSREVKFVGVWDTVGALGIPRGIIGFFADTDEFYDSELGSNVEIARHALAIDEEREDFLPTLWEAKDGLDLKQVWFAGVHSDLGGSYGPDEDTGFEASDTPLKWMLDEAETAGLIIESQIRNNLNESIHAKLHKSNKGFYRFADGEHRELKTSSNKPTTIHPTVKERYEQDPKYRPKKLKEWVNRDGWDAIQTDG